MTSPHEVLNKMVEVWNAHDREAWMMLCSPDVKVHGEPAGAAGWGEHYNVLQTAFPDGTLEVTSSAQEHDLVYSEVTLTGTHTGALPPWQATGRRVKLDFGCFLRVLDGKLISLSAYGIAEGLTQHLGMAPPVEASR